MLAVIGGSGCGKTTFIKMLMQECAERRVQVIRGDDYYFDLSHLTEAQRRSHNYDHPDALDWQLMATHLDELRAGKEVDCPCYDFTSHTRRGSQRLTSCDLILLDGIMLTHAEQVRRCMDFTVYVDAPADLRFIRRLRRDIRERGRDLEGVIEQYLTTVRPMHEAFVEPLKAKADVIVDWTHYNDQAVRSIADIIAASMS